VNHNVFCMKYYNLKCIFFFFGSVHSKNQVRFLSVFEKNCLNPNNEKSPVEVEFYLINSNGDYSTLMNEEFINLLDNHRFDYKSNVSIRLIIMQFY